MRVWVFLGVLGMRRKRQRRHQERGFVLLTFNKCKGSAVDSTVARNFGVSTSVNYKSRSHRCNSADYKTQGKHSMHNLSRCCAPGRAVGGSHNSKGEPWKVPSTTLTMGMLASSATSRLSWIGRLCRHSGSSHFKCV